MNRPTVGLAGLAQRLAPLAQASLFADVDLLPRADQPDQHAPLRDALAELDKGLRLRHRAWRSRVLGGHLLNVPGPLRLVVDDHVLRRHRRLVAEVLLHVVLDVAHEGLAAATGVAQLVLQHLHERAVAAEEDGGRRRLAAGALDSEIVEAGLWTALRPTSVFPSPARQRRARDAACACGGLVRDAGDRVDGRLGLGPGAVNRPDLAVQEELARRLNQRGERAVGVLREELLGGQRALGPRALQSLDELVQCVGPAMCTPSRTPM